eukprot:967091-Rhodomonas_salina.1
MISDFTGCRSTPKFQRKLQFWSVDADDGRRMSTTRLVFPSPANPTCHSVVFHYQAAVSSCQSFAPRHILSRNPAGCATSLPPMCVDHERACGCEH